MADEEFWFAIIAMITTRVSVETENSTGLFLFIHLQSFQSQNDIN